MDIPIDPDIIESTSLVYADGRHNIAPDVTEWKGYYYLTFSNGSNHLKWDHQCVILRSKNLRDWHKIQTTAYPARDSFLVARADQLLLYYIFYDPDPDGELGPQVETRMISSVDGLNWSSPQRQFQPLHNFWRPKMHDNEIYTASDYLDTTNLQNIPIDWYHGMSEHRRVDLLRSPNGLEWTTVSNIVTGPFTETELLFRANNELWALSRPRTLSRTSPPYQDWSHAELPEDIIGGPALIELQGTVYLAGRRYSSRTSEGKRAATVIWKHDSESDTFQPLTSLPEPGFVDTSYPAFLTVGTETFIFYYSSHRYREIRDFAQVGSPLADIFIAKLCLAN
jgi:hypothetical protein